MFPRRGLADLLARCTTQGAARSQRAQDRWLLGAFLRAWRSAACERGRRAAIRIAVRWLTARRRCFWTERTRRRAWLRVVLEQWWIEGQMGATIRDWAR